jgi:manganese oxidase
MGGFITMSRQDESLWVREDADRGKWREAEQARQNRREIQQALNSGEISRRELVKWGLYTSAAVIAPIGGLSPFVRSAHGQTADASSTFRTGAAGTGVPTGLPLSPTFGVLPFTSPMYRMDILPQYYVPGSEAAKYPMPSIPQSTTALSPVPTAEANTTQQPVNPLLVNGTTGLTGPIEGRPPGSIWAHQKFSEFPPQIQIRINSADAVANSSYSPGVASNFNSGINAYSSVPGAFNPSFPVQTNNSMWLFEGTLPPKLMISRYGFPALMREYNQLPFSITQNGVNSFGRYTLSTHEHNAHHGAENDGFTGAYFYPGEFYDYHYPWTLAGWTSINTGATVKEAGAPDGNGGIVKVPGDWHETMSSHWFHDHMFTFTDQNVYKGFAGMNNIYSALDRGNEGHNDGINLRLPSGTQQDFANLEYDINLMFADKAWDKNGQLDMDTAQFDGFLGDQMTVNLCWKPFLEVYARKYRFRLLNGAVSRFFVFALSDSKEIVYIANDGNLLPTPVSSTTPQPGTGYLPVGALDQLGVAERYDVVIDFSRYKTGATLYLVNLQEQTNGKLPDPANILTVAEAMKGDSLDPAVGPCLQFRVLGPPPVADQSVIPPTMIPNPTEPAITNSRTFQFSNSGELTQDHPVSTYDGNGTNGGNGYGLGSWSIATFNDDVRGTSTVNICNMLGKPIGNGNDDANCKLLADFGRISAAPNYGTAETWTLINGGTWDHPVHIHFEEGHILRRATNGGTTAIAVPEWETGRKDVYRLRPGDEVTLFIQFRDWGGMFMEHCHNTMHEDNAMLLRWEINDAGGVFLNPLPTPIPSPTGVSFPHADEILAGAFPPNNSTTNGYPGGPSH